MGDSLSVVIPAFNSAASIVAAVTSAERVGAREVVVVDDGSFDGTAERAREIGARVIVQQNQGASAARAHGLEVVAHEYVAFLDADDELVSEGVRRSIAMLEASAELGAAIGAFEAVLPGGGRKVSRPWPSATVPELLRRGYSPAPPGAIVWRRKALERSAVALPAPVQPRYAEDYELLIRAARVAPVGCHAEIALRYRLTGGKSTRAPVEAAKCAIDLGRYYADYDGIPLAARPRGAARAQAALRRAGSRPGGVASLASIFLVTYAFVNDPRFITRWFLSGVRGRVRFR